MPKEGEKIQFKDYNRSMKVPFVMYADFECLLTPISTCNPSPIAPYTKKYQHHEATSYCLYTTRHDDQLEKPITYFGPDAAHHFVNTIENESTRIADLYSKENKIPMNPLTEEEKRTVETVKNCHICNHLLKDDRVLDHDHLTGKFRGVAITPVIYITKNLNSFQCLYTISVDTTLISLLKCLA